MTKSTKESVRNPEANQLDPEVVEFRARFDESSPLDEIVRNEARTMLQAAIESEVDQFLSEHSDRRDEAGRRLVVRNGHQPSRQILTGAGSLEIKQPRVRDNSPDRDQRVQFSSSILPPCLRRSKSIDEPIPWLYLKGVSTGDFSEALQSLLKEDAKGLSPNVIVRLKEHWSKEYEDWSRRDLSDKEYVYFWADGIHTKVRLEVPENDKQCMLVLMGATADGKKELIAVVEGYRESEQSWYELLIDLKQRGLKVAPKLATADGALGFWVAVRKVFPETREQRCWMHKTGNVLNSMPKSVLDGGHSGGRRESVRCLSREVPSEIRRRLRMPHQGSRGTLGLLRLPCRAMETLADNQSHRVDVRHDSLASPQDEGKWEQTNLPGNDVQTRSVRRETMATTKRPRTDKSFPPRKEIR